MTYADQLCFIASAIMAKDPETADALMRIAAGVRREGRRLDELALNAQEDALLAEHAAMLRLQGAAGLATADIVHLDAARGGSIVQFPRRERIGGGA